MGYTLSEDEIREFREAYKRGKKYIESNMRVLYCGDEDEMPKDVLADIEARHAKRMLEAAGVPPTE